MEVIYNFAIEVFPDFGNPIKNTIGLLSKIEDDWFYIIIIFVYNFLSVSTEQSN